MFLPRMVLFRIVTTGVLADVCGSALKSAPGTVRHHAAAPAAALAGTQLWHAAAFLAVAGLTTWAIKEARGKIHAMTITRAPLSASGSKAREELELPCWDPLDYFMSDDESMVGEKRRALEVKHGHLSLLANMGLARLKLPPCAQAVDNRSSCSTDGGEGLSELTESSPSEAGSEPEPPVADQPARESSTRRPQAAGLSRPPGTWYLPSDRQDRPPGSWSVARPRCCVPSLAAEQVLPAVVPAWSSQSGGCRPAGAERPPECRHQAATRCERTDTPASLGQEGKDGEKPCEEPEMLKTLPRGSRWSDCADDMPSPGLPACQPASRPPVLCLADAVAPVQSLADPTHQCAPGVESSPALALPPLCYRAIAPHTGCPVLLPTPVPAAASRARGEAAPTARARRPGKDMTLQDIMQDLNSVDEERVLIVRRIKQLGFSSGSRLREHFEQFGRVEQVLMSHSHVQQRVRPASLGFVVMVRREDAEAALAAGGEQEVLGHTILVCPFKHPEGRTPV